MLARLERRLLSGEFWRYEPKFDGFRGLLRRAPKWLGAPAQQKYERPRGRLSRVDSSVT
jgi:hypothetical protein